MTDREVRLWHCRQGIGIYQIANTPSTSAKHRASGRPGGPMTARARFAAKAVSLLTLAVLAVIAAYIIVTGMNP